MASQKTTPSANEDPLWYRQRDTLIAEEEVSTTSLRGNQNGHAESPNDMTTNGRHPMFPHPLPPSPPKTRPLPSSPDPVPRNPMANRPLPLSPDDSQEWWISASSTELQRNGRDSGHGSTLPSVGLHTRLGGSMTGDPAHPTDSLTGHNPLYRRMSSDIMWEGHSSFNGAVASTLPTAARAGGGAAARNGRGLAGEPSWQSGRWLRKYRSESDQVMQ
jgi:hypothetical protein